MVILIIWQKCFMYRVKLYWVLNIHNICKLFPLIHISLLRDYPYSIFTKYQNIGKIFIFHRTNEFHLFQLLNVQCIFLLLRYVFVVIVLTLLLVWYTDGPILKHVHGSECYKGLCDRLTRYLVASFEWWLASSVR